MHSRSDEASVFESGLIKPLDIVLFLRLRHRPVGAAHVLRVHFLRCVDTTFLLGNVFFCPTPWSEGAAPVLGGSRCFDVSMVWRPDIEQ